MKKTFQPVYLELYDSGVLKQRCEQALEWLNECRVCPRLCRTARHRNEQGVCQTGRLARVASCFPHHGEEDCLRGTSGSGAIFFSGCNLHCIFCQNFDISHQESGVAMSPSSLAQMMLGLQKLGCHNINLVTPSHVIPQILEALLLAIPDGLCIPIVYNSGGYDSVESLQLLDGVIDIYMPDVKFFAADKSKLYLSAPDYPKIATEAVCEMHRQVGDLAINPEGIAERGILVRHLVMPGCVEDSQEIMAFLAEKVSNATYVNIMGQYRPEGHVSAQIHPELNRRITHQELIAVYDSARRVGLHRFAR